MSRVIRETLHHGTFRATTDTPLAGEVPTPNDVQNALNASPYGYGANAKPEKVAQLAVELRATGLTGHGWSWFALVDVPDPAPSIRRAVCMCGYVAILPEYLEEWNESSTHYGQDDNSSNHAVSVWTLSDGRVTIADNRSEEQK